MHITATGIPTAIPMVVLEIEDPSASCPGIVDSSVFPPVDVVVLRTRNPDAAVNDLVMDGMEEIIGWGETLVGWYGGDVAKGIGALLPSNFLMVDSVSCLACARPILSFETSRTT